MDLKETISDMVFYAKTHAYEGRIEKAINLVDDNDEPQPLTVSDVICMIAALLSVTSTLKKNLINEREWDKKAAIGSYQAAIREIEEFNPEEHNG